MEEERKERRRKAAKRNESTFLAGWLSRICPTYPRRLSAYLHSLERTNQCIKLGHPVQFPSRLIVPSPTRLSATPRRGRAKNARPILGRRFSGERGNDATRRWKKQRGRERRPAGGGRGKRGRKEARKCGGVDSTVLRGFRAAASLPRASLARNSANATRPSFLPSFLLHHRLARGILGIFFPKFSFSALPLSLRSQNFYSASGCIYKKSAFFLCLLSPAPPHFSTSIRFFHFLTSIKK